MSFRVLGEDLDFTIYGGSNTNQLQLSAAQLSRLQKQQRVANAQHLQEGPDLTGYQSGLFDNGLSHRSVREKKEKKRSAIAFAEQHPPSRSSSKKHLQHVPQHQQQLQHTPALIFTPVTDQVDDDDVVGTASITHSGHKGKDQGAYHRHFHAPTVTKTTVPANAFEDKETKQKREGNEDEIEGIIHGLEVLETLPIPTLRPNLARSATIISTTSSSGRPRLTHRLSYLTQLDDLEAAEKIEDEEQKVAILAPISSYSSLATVEQESTAGLGGSPPAPPPFKLPSPSTAQHRSTVTPIPQPTSLSSYSPRVALDHGSRSKIIPSSVNSPMSVQVTPPIPKLYKRLLRVFKPPSDSSDDDTNGASNHHRLNSSAAAAKSTARVVEKYHAQARYTAPVENIPHTNHSSFGLLTSPGNSSRGSPKSRPSINRPVEKPAVIFPTEAAVLSQKPPESTGFRARILRKLKSSPNLNVVTNPPPQAAISPMPVPRADQSKSLSPKAGQEPLSSISPLSPLSPLPSDFEHDHCCPAGQRILDRKLNHGVRPRASTLPKPPTPVPTLQSKYGVPGRELGAGTQAQVMLLRVKSTKRLRNSYPLSRNKSTVSPTQSSSKAISTTASPLTSGTIVVQDSPRHGARSNATSPPPGESLLSPRSRSGTLMTTTEDDVTPEQREAYRKRLLRRTSTSGASASHNGGLIYAIKKFRPPKATETHRQYLKKICAEFCISTSMDHENIIRTIDLVRDQPGQELVEEGEEYKDKRTQRSHGGIHEVDWQDYVEGHQDDARDCNCPRDRHTHRRIQSIKSHGEPVRSSSRGEGSSGSSSSPKMHRPIPRKSVISKPHRKRSIDTYSISRGSDETVTPQGSSRQLSYFHQSRQNDSSNPSNQNISPGPVSSQAVAAAKKKKQQLEQELRQKEVQRLKAQRLWDKQQAKQQRLDQFPEYCMVMEFAAGGDLFNLLTKSHPPISLNEKHCLWRQLVNGVQYMHSMGVAHRDLKPENILIDASGKILKITDFGIANVFKSVGDPTPLPCKGIIGSEPYIAPEEFYQEEYDPRAVDVWACGIVFYVMYYAAMPWARADRKKDARYARYINDITNHRYSEAQRRLQFERHQIYQNGTSSSGGRPSSGGTTSSISTNMDTLSRPHEASHHRQYPPYRPSDLRITHNKVYPTSTSSSNNSASPTSPLSQGETVTPHSSTESSPVSYSVVKPSQHPLDWAASSATTANSLAPTVIPPVYNTYTYNGHLGGHEFIDRIETPGCRRILYAIMEPDPKKRLTIEQVAADEWVSRIHFCSDEIQRVEGEREHHRHFQPKPVRS
ncbi:serine/threonine-protein kinase HAL4/sat4 [Gryganskiella cystojenkinii]|nr:serine/threonine-protein kinase HAL4/sat4 [Gryganskiella cystojenkinii]